MGLNALILASHCVDNPALCEPAQPSPWAGPGGLAGSLLTVAAMTLAISVCTGRGLGAGIPGLKRAIWLSVGLVVAAFLLLSVPGSAGYFLLSPLLILPLIAFGFIRLLKESGNTLLAKRLGIGLGVALGVSGLIVVGAAIVFGLALAGWANSK